MQKKALALCLHLPVTSSREAMEMAAGMLPLDLRLCEIAIRNTSKIAAKRHDNRLDRYRDEDV